MKVIKINDNKNKKNVKGEGKIENSTKNYLNEKKEEQDYSSKKNIKQ